MTPDQFSSEERPAAGDPAATRVAVVLDEAIVHLAAGESVEAVLARYPDQDADLRPLLEIAGALKTRAPAPAPVDAVRDRVRQRVMLAARTSLRPAQGDGDGARPRQLRLVAADLPVRLRWPHLRLGPAQLGGIAAGLAILAFSGGGAVFASGTALPGQPLYPVKLALEDARVAVAHAGADPQARVSLHTELAGRRLDEAQALAISGQSVPPQVVLAAEEHVAAAAAVVEHAPEPSRAQLSALVTAAESRRDVAVSRVLEQVPPAAQQSIARALENGRGRRADPSAATGPGATGPGATGPGATGPGATALPVVTVPAGTSASSQEAADAGSGASDGRDGRSVDDRGPSSVPSGVSGGPAPSGRGADEDRGRTGGREEDAGRGGAAAREDEARRNEESGRDGERGRDSRPSPALTARNTPAAPPAPGRPIEGRPAENRAHDDQADAAVRPTPEPREPADARRNDDGRRGNERESEPGRDAENERGQSGGGRTPPTPTAARVVAPPDPTAVLPPTAPAVPSASGGGASGGGATGSQPGSSGRPDGTDQGAARQNDRQESRADSSDRAGGNERPGGNGRAAGTPTVTPERAADNPGRGDNGRSGGGNTGGGGRGRN